MYFFFFSFSPYQNLSGLWRYHLSRKLHVDRNSSFSLWWNFRVKIVQDYPDFGAGENCTWIGITTLCDYPIVECSRLEYYGIFLIAWNTYGPVMGANAEKEETEIYKIPMHDGGEDMAVWCFILAYAPTNLFHNNLF